MMLVRINLLVFLFLFSSNLIGQHISLGGGIPYNATSETVGINLRGYYNIEEHICFGPEFTYFFPRTVTVDDEEIETLIWEINFNAHYIFEVSEGLGVYPIFGLNYTREIENIDFLSSGMAERIVVDAIGLNIGGGFHVPQPSFIPFVEYEYVVGDLSEHIITAGVFFTIGRGNEEIEIHESENQ